MIRVCCFFLPELSKLDVCTIVKYIPNLTYVRSMYVHSILHFTHAHTHLITVSKGYYPQQMGKVETFFYIHIFLVGKSINSYLNSPHRQKISTCSPLEEGEGFGVEKNKRIIISLPTPKKKAPNETRSPNA